MTPGARRRGRRIWSPAEEYGRLRPQARLADQGDPLGQQYIPYILPDGTHARGVDGKELKLALPDSDSGVTSATSRRARARSTSGAGRSARARSMATGPTETMPAAVRAGVTPKHQADRPRWRVELVRDHPEGRPPDRRPQRDHGDRGRRTARHPGRKGPIAFQHHGGVSSDGKYVGNPSLVQFRNVRIKNFLD